MSAQDPNYARSFGIHSIAAAIIFTIVYIPLGIWFLMQSFGHPTYVFGVLTLFCAIRIAAFIIRAVLAGSGSAGRSLGLLIADEVLFGVGFFGLLYSAYTLVLDRWSLTAMLPSRDRTSLMKRRIFRLALTIAVALGIAGTSQATSNQPHKGNSLRIAADIIFLILTVILAYQTLLLSCLEIRESESYRSSYSLGKHYGAYILCVIALLLLVREGFSTAMVFDYATQYNEKLWYPLYALPEVLAVMMFTTPGLVPSRSELPT
ncbi:hypothetical protein H0H81_005433 [Sphagnurus paluster]|uniref:DUF7702 domain-containing protein n=1 Tax=Sphagnurus paluster TaxID=117069 RepID=A0A9P7KL48_9AGAR|nr:hypothetical protein H0H81_005433 [Sphagnurus paluster]